MLYATPLICAGLLAMARLILKQISGHLLCVSLFPSIFFKFSIRARHPKYYGNYAGGQTPLDKAASIARWSSQQ
jgi:hypothetical protein